MYVSNWENEYSIPRLAMKTKIKIKTDANF